MDNLNLSNTRTSDKQEQQKLNASVASNSLSEKYHKSEITQNELIVKNAIKMIWAGTIILAVVTIVCLKRNSTDVFVTGISGAFVSFLSATIIYLSSKSSETKMKYFENLSKVEHEQKIIDLIKAADCNNDFQKAMITKMVEKHCSK